MNLFPFDTLIDPPGRLLESHIRELWELRLSMVSLKSEVSPEQDLQSFSAYLASAHRIVRLVEGDEVIGLTVMFVKDGQVGKTQYRWLGTEFAYLAPRWRQHPWVAMQYLRVMLMCWSRRPGVNHYMGAIGYPMSALGLTSVHPDLLLMGDEHLSPVEEAIFEDMMAQFAPRGAEPGKGIWLPTVPGPLPPRWLKRHADSPHFHRYLSRAPGWAEGYGWPLLVKASPLSTFGNSIARARRRWR